MDQDTKNYIDKKFAEQSDQRTGELDQAKLVLDRRRKMTKTFVFGCALIMLILLAFMLRLLYEAQLKGFFR